LDIVLESEGLEKKRELHC